MKIFHKNKTDRNKRLIATVLIGNLNINEELVRNGLAWHYKKYSDNEFYDTLETFARQNKFGLWSDTTVIEPWNWRRVH